MSSVIPVSLSGSMAATSAKRRSWKEGEAGRLDGEMTVMRRMRTTRDMKTTGRGIPAERSARGRLRRGIEWEGGRAERQDVPLRGGDCWVERMG